VNKKQHRILIAPLDWGLGHLSRCIPIIHYLLAQGHSVFFAGNENQQSYIKNVFPHIDYLMLAGYDIRYASKRIFFTSKLIAQIPRLDKCIRTEHAWLKKVVAAYQIDAVISDNRYGLYHTDIPCVLLTHQLNILTGLGTFWDRCLQKIHYRYIQKFAACWVVDTEIAPGLSGILAHPKHLPAKPTTYIGYLSQCAALQVAAVQEPHPYVLVLLSGVEPQRTILADRIWQQVLQLSQKIVFVAGTEQLPVPGGIPEHIVYHQRLSGKALQVCIAQASIVICRSGYSSIMDLMVLGKKAILIPTPGQTEQEYLATHLQQQEIFMMQQQQSFSLYAALQQAEHFPFRRSICLSQFEQYRTVVAAWLKTI
jgi:UDP:flavonoid glycosyltransferase YjiC (YdhE family)